MDNATVLPIGMILHLTFQEEPFFAYASLTSTACQILSGINNINDSIKVSKYPKCQVITVNNKKVLSITDFNRLTAASKIFITSTNAASTVAPTAPQQYIKVDLFYNTALTTSNMPSVSGQIQVTAYPAFNSFLTGAANVGTVTVTQESVYNLRFIIVMNPVSAVTDLGNTLTKTGLKITFYNMKNQPSSVVTK